jgi:hypothetical protein
VGLFLFPGHHTGIRECQGDKLKKDKMGEACSTHVTQKMRTEFYSETLKGRHSLKTVGVDDKIILK